MDSPIVLIFSNGKTTTTSDIVCNIRKNSIAEKQIKIQELTGYLHPISTKYYNTEIVLLPVKELNEIPIEARENIEGILIYFDADDRSFLDIIPKYVDFIKSNDIEFSVLLCDVLEVKNGIQFKELKDCHKMLDIIELGRKLEEDEEEDPYNPLGYEELAQALRSVIWSNVNVSKVSGKGISLEDEASSPDPQENMSEEAIENELESFEKLLSQVMSFHTTTENMNRHERLTYAQQFAEVFEKLIVADEEDKDNPPTGNNNV